MNTALTYGVIAFSMFEFVRSTLFKNSKVLNDGTGILALIIKYFEAISAGFKYYPVLVAFRNNQVFISLTSSVLIWFDFTKNIIQYGNCDTVLNENLSYSESKRRLLYY